MISTIAALRHQLKAAQARIDDLEGALHYVQSEPQRCATCVPAGRTRGEALALYHRGGQLARNYDKDRPDVLEDALEKLVLARDIFYDRGMFREAAFAANFAAEALMKLGRFNDARLWLGFARVYFGCSGAEDQRVSGQNRRLEDELQKRREGQAVAVRVRREK